MCVCLCSAEQSNQLILHIRLISERKYEEVKGQGQATFSQ